MRSATSSLEQAEAVAVAHVRRVAHEIVGPTLGGPATHRWATQTQVHTQHDERAGAALESLFQGSFPGHGLDVEDRPAVRGDGRHVWHIDPIDGSANHLRGIPYVSVSAGLERDGELAVGVVHDVVRDITFSAHRGGGARSHPAQGDPLPLQMAGTEQLADAMLIAHLARRGPLMGLPGALYRLLWNVRKIRCMGSIALDLALLAAGEADLLVVGRGTSQRMLDIVGGWVLLIEAGGTVMTASGGTVDSTTRTLIAGPSGLCEQFVELMRPYDLEGWTADQAPAPA